MAKHFHNVEAELVTLAHACARAGITPPTAVRLSARGEFPAVVYVGRRRMVATRKLSAWLAKLVGEDANAAA